MRRKVVVDNNTLLDDVAKIIASTGQQVVLLTKGQSMLPFIVGNRDSVELSPITDKIRRGDILLAKLTLPTTSYVIPRYVIHRVIKIEGERVTLMGDGNLVGTEQCHKDCVVARVTSIIKPHKSIDPNSKREQLFASIWRILRPIRRYLLAILRRI